MTAPVRCIEALTLLFLGVSVVGCGDETRAQSAASSIRAAIVLVQAWEGYEVPDHFAADAIEAEIRVLAALAPAFENEADLPIDTLIAIKSAIARSDRKGAEQHLPRLTAAAQSLHATP